MAKYYSYNNASRRLRSGKFTYSFDIIAQFGGGWQGVLKLENPEEIATLESFGPKLGVREITEDEYLALVKKKTNSTRPSPSTIHLPPSPIKPAEAVVRVKDLNPTTRKDLNIAVEPTKPSVDEVVTLGQAPYVDPLEQRSKTRKRKPSSAS